MDILEELKLSAHNKEVCFLSSKGVDLTFETQIVDVNEKHLVIMNTIPFEYIAEALQGDQFSLQCGKNKVYASSLENDGVNIIFPFDSTKSLNETREEERFSFRSHDDVVLKILNPFDNETELVKPILDMSSSGISIRTKLKSKLFEAGVKLEKMEVFRDGKVVKTSSGEVVYSRNYLDLSGVKYCQVGIRIF